MPAVILMLTLFLLAAPPTTTAAIPTVECHCFQDRAFDLRRPAAIDPYLLATTQNSLIAAVYQVPKRELVRRKMTGTGNDEIWVTLHRGRTGHPDRAVDPADYPQLARKIVDETVTMKLGIDPAEVAELRRLEATNAELILAAYLSHKGELGALKIFSEVRENRSGWGQILTRLGGVVPLIEEEILTIVKRAESP